MTLSDDLPRDYHERALEEKRGSPVLVTAPRHLYGQAVVLQDIADERDRQLIKWGPQSHPDGTEDTANARELRDMYRAHCDRMAKNPATDSWLNILREETYEAFAEVGAASLRKELVQAAAVAVAWIEDIDSRRG